MLPKRTVPVYALLALLWVLLAAWQGTEYLRFRRVAYESLLNRGREIAGTMGVVIRSQGRFGMVRQSRLEAALEELAHSTDLHAVMLLNAGGQIVASAGKSTAVDIKDLSKQSVRWDAKHGLVTIVDLVDLGTNAQSDGGATVPPAIVLREEEIVRRRPPPGPLPGFWGGIGFTSNTLRPPATPDPRPLAPPKPAPFEVSRPFWMSAERYNELLQKQGLHSFVLQLPTTEFRAETRHDLWIRLTTVTIALIGVMGLGLAWRGTQRMNQLQIRLLRASEMNAHLRELNVAAAGLAHETRNPLNIVRGMAQIIAQKPDADAEIRHKARVITEEVDRVTGRLNEFISYSHSPKPKPAPTDLRGVVGDVQRALESDQSEKGIVTEAHGPALMVEADESLLRQVVFNLLLNAYQAVGAGGHVRITVVDGGHGEAALEVGDNGPGVPPELREDIFKPYFTTRAEGTGLGLAVVKQIVLAHQWELEYLSGNDGGAVFRVSAMRVVRG